MDREEVLALKPGRFQAMLKLHLRCRAAERYAETSREDRERRRARGWDLVRSRISSHHKLIVEQISAP
jgi:hypothetical protein